MSTTTILKRFLFIVLLLTAGLSAGSLKAQTVYGNEWINYSQTYYKIKVTNTGLHRISAGYLDTLGLSNINPQHFQLFRRGKEVAIYVSGEQDGRIDAQDFIEFFGERNDGLLDRDLYKNSAHQMHQLFSFYTDTASYFLTHSPAGGKRMRVVNPAVTGLTPEPYHLQKLVRTVPERYYYGKVYGVSQKSWIEEGEGYFSHSSRNSKNYNLGTLTNVVNTGPKPRLVYGVGALNEITHNFAVRVVAPTGARELARHTIEGDGATKGTAVLEFTDINAQGAIVFQTLPDAHATTLNQISFSFSGITYPQRSVFSGNSMLFYTDSTRSATPYFEFTNAPATAVAYDVTDQGEIVRIVGHVNGTSKGYVVQNNTITRKLLLADTAKPFKPVGKPYQINFRNINAEAHNYIILTNKRLMKKVGGAALNAPVEYAAYRASEQGGSYDTLLVHMDQIIDQFHYGEFSPNSIRRMMKFMMTSDRAKHFFIIGKGARYASDEYYYTLYPGKYSYYHIGSRLPNVYEYDLIPSGIAPVSDVLLTADFHNNEYEPRVPTGRLAAIKPEDIISYLNKIKEYEAVPEGLAWRKNILQLGGGKTQQEITQISSYLRGYKRIAEGPFLGANVIEKYRQNLSEVVETVNVTSEVNAGLSLITFFGHSSPGSTDLDIGYVSGALSGYRNKGKYPIMLMLGCGTGETFLPNNISFGEDWLNTPDRGAVALIAHAQAGYPPFLNLYASNFYTVAFQDPVFYGKTLGEIQKETIRRVNRTTSNELAVAMVFQMILQGDPALSPYTPSKPDYLVTGGAFDVEATDGSVLTSASEEFIISFNVNNLGKVINDSVNVSVKRTLTDNTVILSERKIKPIFRNERVQLILDNREVAGAEGVNNFEVFLDHTNSIEELNEENNIGRFQYFFPASGILAINPVNYGIVNTKTVNISVQASQAANTRKSYHFELDTTQLFNSSLKQTQSVTDEVLPTWQVTLPDLGANSDSVVYYWRARFEHYEAGEDTLWASSSFRHINNGLYGWSQSHYGQFEKAQTKDIDRISTKSALAWEFSPFQTTIEMRTVGGDIRFTADDYGLFVDGVREMSAGCSNPFGSSAPRIFFIVFDNITLQKVTTIPGFTGCSTTPHLYDFGTLNTVANRQRYEDFLKAIPEGFHVAAVSVNNVPFESFTDEFKDAFRSIGSGLIGDLKNGYPFAIVGTKGAAAGSAFELTASAEPETSDIVILNTQLFSRKPAGTITSSVIGPAQNWGSVFHDIKLSDADDAYKLSLIGLNISGVQEVLADDIKDKNFDISHVDAEVYPNLQLSVFLSDTTARTVPQLKQWMVTFVDNTPEGIIRPDLVTVNEEILTEQSKRGSITIPMAFQNISDFAFDTLVVEVTLTGEGILEPQVTRFKIDPVKAHTTAYFSHTINTATMVGSFRVTMFVNPRLHREKQYNNNFFEVSFKVNPRLHPTMEVAFDGIPIMDGELVSPSPLISITVRDENKFAFLKEPTGMSVVMLDAQGLEKTVDLMNKDEVDYFPADEKNDFRVEYKPRNLANGTYTLVVSARDAIGQATGTAPYRINFEVVNESTITNFYPYPNPFSTKTNFIFTLTGNTLPDNFKIQVLTVTGKVVKEILKEELGPIRIGNNKSDYAWDGTDTYGDKLANGVYLYRVVMPQTEEEMKHRDSAADKAFKNGYGKLYILR